MTIGIYQIKNKVNGKFYIGKSQAIETRVKCQQQALKKNYHVCKNMQNDYNKGHSFSFEEIAKCSYDKLDKMEQFFIKTLKAVKKGYNIVTPTLAEKERKGKRIVFNLDVKIYDRLQKEAIKEDRSKLIHCT